MASPLACAAALALLLGQSPAEAPPAARPAATRWSWSGVERIVAVGDVHGAYREFVSILKAAGLVDEKLHWAGGKTHLVQTGDIPDRGPEPKKAFDLLRRLEREAAEAGGRVHALIGNHEAMMIERDFRYVHPAALKPFVTAKSAALRDAFLRAHPRLERRDVPLGWIEHRDAFSPSGEYGAWITSHNAAVKINDTLFLHGGLSSRFAAADLGELNEKVRSELRQKPTLEALYPTSDNQEGPLWFRGYAHYKERELAGLVKEVLEVQKASRIVVGHSVTGGRIERRAGGRVVLIDCGMNPVYRGGRAAALEITGDQVREIYARDTGNP
jgi:hypothetical protein